MAKNKTNISTKSVDGFISKVAAETMRDDSYQLIELFKDITGFEPALWGPSIIGFGSYHYKYESGHEGDMPLIAFSPRKSAIVIYTMLEANKKEELLKKLGKFKGSKGCLYIKKLEDINVKALKKLIAASVKHIQKKYQAN